MNNGRRRAFDESLGIIEILKGEFHKVFPGLARTAEALDDAAAYVRLCLLVQYQQLQQGEEIDPRRMVERAINLAHISYVRPSEGDLLNGTYLNPVFAEELGSLPSASNQRYRGQIRLC